MATKKEKQELVDILKFTPIKVQLMLQGYGGEAYAGVVDRKIYDYFKEHKIDLEEYTSDWDGENFAFVPEDMRPFEPSQQYECDNLWHASGAELSNLNEIILYDENNNEMWSCSAGFDDLNAQGVVVGEGGGTDLDDLDEGTVVYWGGQGEKGCFFDAEFTLRAPFDPKKLHITYENCDGWWLITGVEYDGEELDGYGGYSTTGKWGENKWIIIGDEEVYESVSFEDREEEFDPVAELDKIVPPEGFDWEPLPEINFTPWFEADVKPAYKGEYEVSLDAEWPMSGIIRAEWTGRTWKDSDGKKVKIKGWRGLAENPEA